MSTELLPLKPKPVTKSGELCFVLSVSNIIFSTWLMSIAPWNYWCYHVFKNAVYIAIKYIANKQKKWQYFLVDFCYTVNYWSFLYYLVCLLKAKWSAFAFLRFIDDLGPIVFRIAFSWSTGVLATSIAVFSNAMVFHSPEHMSILAVHIGPPLVVWGMRWYSQELNQAWPDTFHTGCSVDNCVASNWELIAIPAVAYFVMWTIPYSLLLFVWHEKRIKEDNYVTMFSYYEKSLFPSSWHNERVKQAIYMLIHGSLCTTSFVWASLLWDNYWLHTGYLLLLLHISIYNGATYYFRVCMNPEKLLKSLESKADARIKPSHNN